MSYFVNKTDGTVITVLDGTKDTTSTSIVLFGRLVQNYGDQTNENFVRLLENFSFTSSPPNPISGQLWFDRNSNNIKVYTTANTWVTVGSVIQGNVDISGNLEIGPTGFAIKDLNGNVEITNSANIGNISIYANVSGVSTRVMHVNSLNGLIEVNANATSNFGVTTKLYVDSEIEAATSNSDTNLLANVSIIEANLAERLNQTVSVETAMIANVAAANARVNAANASITAANASILALNTAFNLALTTNLASKADLVSPSFAGTPAAPTAAFGANTLQIATTEYVMTRSVFWDGSRKFVSTGDPTVSDGNDGDIWFKYIP